MSAYLTSLFLFTSNHSGLDTARQSLETESGRWFGWLVRASIIVGVGVILEAPEATIALIRWYRLRKGEDVEPANEKSLVIPILSIYRKDFHGCRSQTSYVKNEASPQSGQEKGQDSRRESQGQKSQQISARLCMQGKG